MTERDHRNWFRFLEKLATLSGEYSVDDLKWLKKEASRRYPSAIPLIEACLNLANSDSKPLRSGSLNDEGSPMKRHADARDASPISLALFDTDMFPGNSDLVALAKATIPKFPDLRFDKMGRARIVDTVLAHVQKAPEDARKSFEQAVLGEVGSPKSVDTGGSFLSGWEKVIKGT